MSKENLAVLMGGVSSERDISIKSGRAVCQALENTKFNAIPIILDNNNPIPEIRKAQTDLVFIALHGRFGEDGAIQQLLQNEGINYTGSGPDASALAMDKISCRKIFQENAIPVPPISNGNDFPVWKFFDKFIFCDQTGIVCSG